MSENINKSEETGLNPEPQVTPVQGADMVVQQPQPTRRIGNNRSVFAPLLLPFVTFGIYIFVWFYKLYTEADFYCERKVPITSGGAAVGLLFVPIFNFVWIIMLMFKTPDLLTKMQIADGVPESEVKHYGNYGLYEKIVNITVIEIIAKNF